MRILSLRLKNINSLQGEWKIDFTAEPFASNGLFAITGPTGAGNHPARCHLSRVIPPDPAVECHPQPKRTDDSPHGGVTG
ncbi:AAA family ATPase [Yersinia enterocolitica subsp. palearctica]|nr:AAA family ATPase [Yersinia enterocolitica subsp. palearctica]